MPQNDKIRNNMSTIASTGRNCYYKGMMNTFFLLAFMPLVGGLIGWITNVLAVKLIFRPYQPVKLPLMPIALQGVVPKRRAELAQKIGQVVEQELLSGDDILQKMRSPDMVDKLLHTIKRAVNEVIVEKVPPWVPLSMQQLLLQAVSETITKVAPSLVERAFDQAGNDIKNSFAISQLVEERLNSYPIEDIERIIVSVAARELKHIEILGGVLGFIVGLLQFVVIQLLSYI